MIDPATILPLFTEGQPLRVYLCGVFGSVALELINILRVYEAGRVFPARYRRLGYWVVRLMVAIVAGGVAVVLKANSDYLSFYTGMTAPALIIAMSRRPPESGAPS